MLYSVSMTHTETGPIIIDTPDGLAFFRLLQIEGRLAIEISTGLKFRGPNTRMLVNAEYGQKFPASKKGKQAALDFIRGVILEAKCKKALADLGFTDPSQEDIDWIKPAVIAYAEENASSR